MNLRSQLLLILLLPLTIFSCKKKSEAVKPASFFEPAKGIYVSGYTFNSPDLATLWKNDTSLPLGAGRAVAVTYRGNDIYTLVSSDTAVEYWKNNVKTTLQIPADAFRDITASQIAVAGTDVYVLGSYTTKAFKQIFFYWKNGVPVIDPDASYYAIASDESNDIFMIGYVGGKFVYTQNGGPITITGFYPVGMHVWAGNVALYGTIPTKPNASAPTWGYWKNGVITDMGPNISLSAIFVKGGDVYVAGYDHNLSNGYKYGGTYWKNGVPTRLDPNKARNVEGDVSDISGIYVDVANNVYISGQSYRNNIGGVAAYWKNGSTQVALATAGSWAKGIIVVE